MININNVSKTFHTKTNKFNALNNVSLKIKKNTIHGIIGPSGAGKSTLIRIINKIEVYDEGFVDVLEYKDIKKINKESTRMLRKRIGMIFQGFNLLNRQTVYENISFPVKLNRKLNDNDHQRINDLIKIVGLEGYENSYPSQLSGGQKQRVGIARALVNNPEVLLCDEPTSALDTTTIKSILTLLNNLKEKFGLTIVLVTHDMNVIKEICDQVTVMDKGIVVEDDLIDNIIFNPKNDVTKSLLGTVGLNIEEVIFKYNSINNLYLLKFDKVSKQESIISDISLEFKVKVNILYANITPKEKGIMLISILNDNKDFLIKIIKTLKAKGVEVRNV